MFNSSILVVKGILTTAKRVVQIKVIRRIINIHQRRLNPLVNEQS